MADQWAVFWTGFFSVGGALLLYWSTRIWEKRRDRIQDQRALRDAKSERLRRTYTEILHAAETVRGMAAELLLEGAGLTGSEEVAKQFQQSFFQNLDQTLMHFAKLRTPLTLEPDERGIGQAFDELRTGYLGFHAGIARRLMGQPVPKEQLQGCLKQVGDSIERIAKEARDHLAELEQPI